MSIDVCIDVCINMCIDVCIDICIYVPRRTLLETLVAHICA